MIGRIARMLSQPDSTDSLGASSIRFQARTLDVPACHIDTAIGGWSMSDSMERSPFERCCARRSMGAVARAAAGIASVVMTAVGLCAQEPARAPTAKDFFRYPFVREAKLSPDGRLLALTAFGSDSYVRLYVADLSKPFELHDVASFDRADVRRFFWVNNRRLVYDAQDLHSDRQPGNGGLWAVDWDGSKFVQLISTGFFSTKDRTGSSIALRVLPTTDMF
jgi:hypothetical protein